MPEIDPLEVRKTEYKINPIFLKRWSPRAMSGEEISDDELFTLFEAARWAPSSYNEQEWRYVWAKKGTQHWDKFFNLLMEANQVWCKNASHLIAVACKDTFSQNGKPNRVAQLDTGMSVENLLLQAGDMGLVAHAMAGFSVKRGKEALNVPEGHTLLAMIAVGKPGSKDSLPKELQEIESPSQRKPLSEIVMEGSF